MRRAFWSDNERKLEVNVVVGMVCGDDILEGHCLRLNDFLLRVVRIEK